MIVNPDSMVTIESQISESQLIEMALGVLEKRLFYQNTLTSPETTRQYLSLKLGQQQREVFCCIYLDTKNHVIAFEEEFYGTIDQVAVYPHEIVKNCLSHNASAVIVAHNHPSQTCEPSKADELITKRLKDALDLIDVRLLDHFIIGGSQTLSLAERGYI